MLNINTLSFLGNKLIDLPSLYELIARFLFNLLSLVILVRYIYYRTSKRKTYLFTYMLIGITIFSLSYLLENVQLQLGMALGLFAVFGILRYRTDNMPIKEMTYLFVVIALSIVNALTTGISLAELVFTNAVVLIAVALSESAETTRMIKSGLSPRMRGMHSIPSISGIVRSMVTTSGRSSSQTRTASAPLRARPTICQLDSEPLPTTRAIRERITFESSTMSSLI